MRWRATSQLSPGRGGPGGSAGSAWRRSSTCQPCPRVGRPTRAGAKFRGRPRSSASRPRARSVVSGRSPRIAIVHPARLDLDAAGDAAARGTHDALEHGRPHVQLDLLGHPHAVVEQVRETIAAARPRLDVEDESIALAGRGELDLAGLEMAVERCEAKGRRLAVDDADGAVPGSRHAHHELVAEGHAPLLAADLLEARALGGRDAGGAAAPGP